jgi:hypothetical protein
MKRSVVHGAALIVALGGASICSAQSIQFDFNTKQGNYTGNANAADSPARFVGALGASDTTWNGVGFTGLKDDFPPTNGFHVADHSPHETEGSVSNSPALLYTNGTPATGVKTDFGAFFQGGNVTWNQFEDFLYDFSGGAGDDAAVDDAFYDSALMKDMFFNQFNEPDTGVIAFRVSGLAPGQYDVFAIAANDYSAASKARTYNVRIGANLNALADDAPEVVGPITGASASAWVQGADGNYGRSTVTINSTSDWITIFSTQPASGNAILNGVQIAAVPEPTTLGVLALGAGLAATRRRRRSNASA